MNGEITTLLNSPKVLTRTEERLVFVYYKENPSIELRNMIVMKNINLVYSIANKLSIENVEMEEAKQEGVFGLITAIDNYDLDRNVKFSTYAYAWISQAISRFGENNGTTVRLPVGIYNDYYKIVKKTDELTVKNNKKPSVEEVAKELNLTVDRIKKVMNAYSRKNSISIETPIATNSSDDEGMTLETTLSDTKNNCVIDDISCAIDAKSMMEDIKNVVTDKEYNILLLRYGFDGGEALSAKAVGDRIGLTSARVYQIEKAALIKIRKLKDTARFQEYRDHILATD